MSGCTLGVGVVDCTADVDARDVPYVGARWVDPNARHFGPWRIPPHAEVVRMFEPASEMNAHLDRPPAIKWNGAIPDLHFSCDAT